MNESTVKLIAKIKKLLSLTEDNGATEAESAAAAAKATALMAEHKLGLTQVEGFSEEEEICKDGLNPDFTGARRATWTGVLLVQICRLNSCQVIRDLCSESRYTIVGKPSNIEVAKITFDFLGKQIVRLSEDWTPCGASKVAFRNGCTKRVCERLEQQRNRLRADPKLGTLMVVEGNALSLRFKELYPHAQVRRSKTTAGRGYSEGKSAGDKVSLGGIGNSGARGSRRLIARG